MCYFDLGVAEALMNLKHREAQQQASPTHLPYSARAGKSQHLPGQGIRLVRQMGRTLSALGQRLEQAGLPQASPH